MGERGKVGDGDWLDARRSLGGQEGGLVVWGDEVGFVGGGEGVDGLGGGEGLLAEGFGFAALRGVENEDAVGEVGDAGVAAGGRFRKRPV